jgi:hypothetical protein
MSGNLAFASAVAELGMLLRNSEHKGNASYAAVAARAGSFRGNDPEGYRAEFIKLADLAAALRAAAVTEGNADTSPVGQRDTTLLSRATPGSAVASTALAFSAPRCRPRDPRSRGSRPRVAICCRGPAHVVAFAELSPFAAPRVSRFASLDRLSLCYPTLRHFIPPRARACNRDAGRVA